MKRYRRKCRNERELLAEKQWPLCNLAVTPMTAMVESDLKMDIRIMSNVDMLVRTRYKEFHGPIPLLLGMATMMEGTKKLHYMLNRMGVTLSYLAVSDIRSRLCQESMRHENGNFRKLTAHDVSVFSIDNLDQINCHGITVAGRTRHSLHFTAIQSILCNVTNGVPRTVCAPLERTRRHESIKNSTLFVDSFLPAEEDVDINTYAAMFIGAVYRHQERIATDEDSQALSIKNLLLSLFEGYGNENEIRHVGIIDDNTANKTAIHKRIEQIYELYGKDRLAEDGLSVLAGDQPTFKNLFWIYYDSLENGANELSSWALPITGGFHDEKKAILSTLKWAMSGSGMEDFLDDSGLSPKQ